MNSLLPRWREAAAARHRFLAASRFGGERRGPSGLSMRLLATKAPSTSAQSDTYGTKKVLFVRNTTGFDTKGLAERFGEYGKVASVEFVKDRFGNNLGQCYILFRTHTTSLQNIVRKERKKELRGERHDRLKVGITPRHIYENHLHSGQLQTEEESNAIQRRRRRTQKAKSDVTKRIGDDFDGEDLSLADIQQLAKHQQESTRLDRFKTNDEDNEKFVRWREGLTEHLRQQAELAIGQSRTSARKQLEVDAAVGTNFDVLSYTDPEHATGATNDEMRAQRGRKDGR